MKTVSIVCLNATCGSYSTLAYSMLDKPMKYCAYCGDEFFIAPQTVERLDKDLKLYERAERRISNRMAFGSILLVFLVLLNAGLHHRNAPGFAVVGLVLFLMIAPIPLYIVDRLYLKPKRYALEKAYYPCFRFTF